MKNRIVAVVCCFNPPIETLDLIQTLSENSLMTVIVDDSSDNLPQGFYDPLHGNENILVITKKRNSGIADSFNIGLEQARLYDADYLIAFDQDSVIPLDWITSMLNSLELAKKSYPDVAAIGPGFIGNIDYGIDRQNRFTSVDEIIQSSALFDVSALTEIGGAETAFVIDGVDSQICLSLQDHGYRIVVDNCRSLEHTVGDGRSHSVAGFNVAITNHSPLRRYYITRNRLVLIRRYAFKHPRWAIRNTRRLMVGSLLSVTFEADRLRKLLMISRGILDFSRSKMGRIGN